MADNTHETKIVISGDATIAVSSLKLVQAQVGKLMGYVKNAFGILGKINWVLGGIQTVSQWFGEFVEWTRRADTAAKALREELAKSSYENAVARAADAYKKLNKNIEEANRLDLQNGHSTGLMTTYLAARNHTTATNSAAAHAHKHRVEPSKIALFMFALAFQKFGVV